MIIIIIIISTISISICITIIKIIDVVKNIYTNSSIEGSFPCVCVCVCVCVCLCVWEGGGTIFRGGGGEISPGAVFRVQFSGGGGQFSGGSFSDTVLPSLLGIYAALASRYGA